MTLKPRSRLALCSRASLPINPSPSVSQSASKIGPYAGLGQERPSRSLMLVDYLLVHPTAEEETSETRFAENCFGAKETTDGYFVLWSYLMPGPPRIRAPTSNEMFAFVKPFAVMWQRSVIFQHSNSTCCRQKT